MNVAERKKAPLNKARVTGIVISTLCILFLIFDGSTKLFKESHSVQGTVKLGWPEHLLPVIGGLCLVCTLFYAIPRTAILGAVLLTAYLGGATAAMVRVGDPFFFQVIFGLLVWVGLYLREPKLHMLMPIKKVEEPG